jgi:hypothetical protein
MYNWELDSQKYKFFPNYLTITLVCDHFLVFQAFTPTLFEEIRYYGTNGLGFTQVLWMWKRQRREDWNVMFG